MFARLFTVIRPIFSRSESVREPGKKPDSAAYKLGYDTAYQSFADNVNPSPSGTPEHADWAEGQFIAGAERQW